MKPGPKPKPRGLRLLEGNRGHAPMPNEPAAEAGYVAPPYQMAPESRAVWDRLAAEMGRNGLMAPRYADGFAAFCESVVACQRAARYLSELGPVVIGIEGGLVSNPASREFRHHAQLMRAYASEYGLTPASVTQIGRQIAESERDRDPSRLLG